MMLTLTCKDLLEPERMTEALFQERAKCEAIARPLPKAEPDTCDPVLRSAEKVCKAADGALCIYEDDKGNKTVKPRYSKKEARKKREEKRKQQEAEKPKRRNRDTEEL